MFLLENEYVAIKVLSKGGELKSFFDKKKQFEWIWQADERFWGKSSPILFPIVGALKENCFQFEDQLYQLSRHGFARDSNFQVVFSSAERLVLEFHATDDSKRNYPFDFTLSISYQLIDRGLQVSYLVNNCGVDDMYFSLGAHPAINFPKQTMALKELCIDFPLDSKLDRYSLNDNLLSLENEQVVLHSNRLFLYDAMFDQDAWVLKGVSSKEIRLKEISTGTGVQFSFENFPFLGLWSVPGATFICLEPWAGLPDNERHNQRIESKEGIVLLKPQSSWSAQWCIHL